MKARLGAEKQTLRMRIEWGSTTILSIKAYKHTCFTIF